MACVLSGGVLSGGVLRGSVNAARAHVLGLVHRFDHC